MASYQQLLHAVALRANALKGAQPEELETYYANTPLTSSDLKSADFPFTHFRDVILQAEQDFVMAVAYTGGHPWAAKISGTSLAVSNGDYLPLADAAGRTFIGLFGAVRDAADSRPCVEMPIDVIIRRNRNAGSHYVTPVYYYKVDAARIYHTRTNVVIDCPVYARTTQFAAFNSNNTMLLPDPAEPGIVARALSYLFRDGVYMEQAAMWRKYSDDAIAMIRTGATNISGKTVPMPVTEVRAA